MNISPTSIHAMKYQLDYWTSLCLYCDVRPMGQPVDNKRNMSAVTPEVKEVLSEAWMPTAAANMERDSTFTLKDSVSHISLLESGGGQRAAVSLLGSLYQLQNEDMLDTLLYMGRVSGSAWSMSCLYSDPQWSANMDRAVSRLSGPGVELEEALAWLGERSQEEHFSLGGHDLCWVHETVPQQVSMFWDILDRYMRDYHSLLKPTELIRKKDPAVLSELENLQKILKDAEELKAKKEQFSTFQLPFSQEKIEFLLDTAKSNIKNNKETLLEEISKAVLRRYKRR
ncbi:hypothetical protein PAMP_009763 [Pampus punctatissimus]